MSQKSKNFRDSFTLHVRFHTRKSKTRFSIVFVYFGQECTRSLTETHRIENEKSLIAGNSGLTLWWRDDGINMTVIWRTIVKLPTSNDSLILHTYTYSYQKLAYPAEIEYLCCRAAGGISIMVINEYVVVDKYIKQIFNLALYASGSVFYCRQIWLLFKIHSVGNWSLTWNCPVYVSR